MPYQVRRSLVARHTVRGMSANHNHNAIGRMFTRTTTHCRCYCRVWLPIPNPGRDERYGRPTSALPSTDRALPATLSLLLCKHRACLCSSESGYIYPNRLLTATEPLWE